MSLLQAHAAPHNLRRVCYPQEIEDRVGELELPQAVDRIWKDADKNLSDMNKDNPVAKGMDSLHKVVDPQVRSPLPPLPVSPGLRPSCAPGQLTSGLVRPSARSPGALEYAGNAILGVAAFECSVHGPACRAG